jgi:hypothetical protein
MTECVAISYRWSGIRNANGVRTTLVQIVLEAVAWEDGHVRAFNESHARVLHRGNELDRQSV